MKKVITFVKGKDYIQADYKLILSPSTKNSLIATF